MTDKPIHTCLRSNLHKGIPVPYTHLDAHRVSRSGLSEYDFEASASKAREILFWDHATFAVESPGKPCLGQ